ncbi:hypothetical protein AgCh_011773 [Apium graveolens]
MESEFVALSATGKEAEWLRNLIYEIPLWPKPISPISIRCDSESALANAYREVYEGKSRHLAVAYGGSSFKGGSSSGIPYVIPNVL